jgi:hypothetical protein
VTGVDGESFDAHLETVQARLRALMRRADQRFCGDERSPGVVRRYDPLDNPAFHKT